MPPLGRSACRRARTRPSALVGERIYRTWLLYLVCSSVAFEDGSIGLYQTLVRKHRDAAGGLAPRTREDLYARDSA